MSARSHLTLYIAHPVALADSRSKAGHSQHHARETHHDRQPLATTSQVGLSCSDKLVVFS